MQNIRETAANAAASAKAGMDKTKATVQEKVERMSAQDPVQKEMATEKKEMRKAEAEANKQAARNAASKMAAQAGAHPQYTTGGDIYTHSTTGVPGYATGTKQMPATGHVNTGYSTGTQQMPATGQAHGGYVDSSGVVQTRPSGLSGDNTGYNTRVEREDPNDGTGAVPPTRFNYL